MAVIVKTTLKSDVLTIASKVEKAGGTWANADLAPFKLVNYKLSSTGASIRADLQAIGGKKQTLQRGVTVGMRTLANFIDKTSRQLKLKAVSFQTNSAGYFILANA